MVILLSNYTCLFVLICWVLLHYQEWLTNCLNIEAWERYRFYPPRLLEKNRALINVLLKTDLSCKFPLSTWFHVTFLFLKDLNMLADYFHCSSTDFYDLQIRIIWWHISLLLSHWHFSDNIMHQLLTDIIAHRNISLSLYF